ncbi:MAG: hypothetical protein PHC41_08420 [Lachnospiraceae bacterium]|nr:hypothetical protein [Lachnospiraceae bacterium]MDD3616232.1 hypothetical protein [Lachnospiraceae bacterium]
MCKKYLIFALCIITISFTGCQKQKEKIEETQLEEQSEEAVDEEKTAEGLVSEEELSGLPQDVADLMRTLNKTAGSYGLGIVTDADLSLNGKLIQGTYGMQAEVQLLRDSKTDDLEMVMNSTSDLDGAAAHAYYKDGWYYTDDANGKLKEEKSNEEVWDSVTEITGLVVDSADSIEQMEVSQENGSTVYRYQIPAGMAEDYLNQMIAKVAVQNTDLKGAKVEVESVEMKSTVDKDGMLTGQKMTLSGDAKKSILKVPAEAVVNVSFSKIETDFLEMPDFSSYS